MTALTREPGTARVAVDVDALGALARAATAGPWATRKAVQGGHDTIGDVAITASVLPSGPGYLPVVGEVWAERHQGYPDNAQARADAAYIAAANPTTILALIAELRTLRNAADLPDSGDRP